MTPYLQITTDLVEECLKDSKVTSAVKMRLAGLIAEKLHEQYDGYQPSVQGFYVDGYQVRYVDCEEAIRIEAEKEEKK